MKLVLTSKPYYRITEQCPSDQYPPRGITTSKNRTHTGKSILRYPGGKTRAIKLILPKLLAQNAQRLISPFFGGGSIEFAWAAAMPDGRVEGMDLYAPVVRFWQHALNEPETVATLVQSFFPLEKTRFYELQKELERLSGVEQAAVFYVLNRASFSGSTMSGGMSPGHKRFTQSAIDRLSAFKSPNVVVTHNDAFDALAALIDQDPSDGVIYLDPPYMLDEVALYGTKGSMHKGFDHVGLAEICQALSQKGWRILISYNDAQSVRDLYTGFSVENACWAYGMKNVSGSAMGSSSEILLYSERWAMDG
jgi:DNA adenine methylase